METNWISCDEVASVLGVDVSTARAWVALLPVSRVVGDDVQLPVSSLIVLRKSYTSRLPPTVERMMRVLVTDGPASSEELAARTGANASHLRLVLGRAAKLGLLRRDELGVDPADKRFRRWRVTDEGGRWLDAEDVSLGWREVAEEVGADQLTVERNAIRVVGAFKTAYDWRFPANAAEQLRAAGVQARAKRPVRRLSPAGIATLRALPECSHLTRQQDIASVVGVVRSAVCTSILIATELGYVVRRDDGTWALTDTGQQFLASMAEREVAA